MIIKEAKYKKVRIWQRREVAPEVNGCDNCRKEIKEFPNEPSRLEMTVWKDHQGESTSLHFCSWKCVLKYIPKIKSEYFASLPYLYFDSGTKARTVTELIKILQSLPKLKIKK